MYRYAASGALFAVTALREPHHVMEKRGEQQLRGQFSRSHRLADLLADG